MNAKFSERNRKRCESPRGFNHKLSAWTASDWMTALMGELGEAANIVKKLNRFRDGVPGNKESIEALRHKLSLEIADTYVYLDLFCQSQEIDLEKAVNDVFTSKSMEIGYVEAPDGK